MRLDIGIFTAFKPFKSTLLNELLPHNRKCIQYNVGDSSACNYSFALSAPAPMWAKLATRLP